LSEVEKEEKQNINNIKQLYKLNNEGVIPTLFREVKKAKQQTFAIVNSLKEKLSNLKQLEVERQKQELLKEVRAKELAVKKEQEKEEKLSFAELFEQNERMSRQQEKEDKIEVVAEKHVVEEKKEPEKMPEVVCVKEEKKEPVKEEVKVVAEKHIKEEKKENSDVSQVAPRVVAQQSNVISNAQQNTVKKDENSRPFTPRNNDRPNNFVRNQYSNNNNDRQNNFVRNQYNNGDNRQNGGFNRGNYNNNYNDGFNRNQNNNGFNRNGNEGYNRNSNYNNGNFARNNNFQQRPYNNQQRPPFKPGERSAFNNRPGENRFQRPFNNNGNNNGFQRRPFNNGQNSIVPGATGAVKAQNRSLMGIIPKKNNNLTAASAAFANKERLFGNKKKTNEYHGGEDERKINKKSLLRRGLIEEQNIEERMVTRKLRLKKQKIDNAPVVCAPVTNAVITTSNLTVKILSEKIGKPVTDIIKQLMVLGIMTTINSPIDFETAELVSNELGVTLEQKVEKSFEEKLKENAIIDDGTNNEKRPPIVTIVGHVDHGKTTLLDYIRKTHVTSKEAGGITQAIGAYSISWKGEAITFIDTPGHEAFINMRKRGTEITDVAVLTVAADDGIKPQTVEAIKHIKEAKVPMVVAVTKIDKQEANIERVKQQLTEYEILPEEWGGDVIVVPVSALTGEGVDKLIETILLVAEMQDLKCNKKRDAVGTIIEAQLDKNRGPVANIIVQNGTLKLGDCVVSGFAFGKIRAMIDDKGKNVSKAGPSMAVSVLGLDSVPNAGDPIQVVDEKFSKNVIAERKIKMAQDKIENGMPKSLDEFLATPATENKKALNLILKANSQGSVEALKQSLLEIKNEEVKIEIISSGVGNINENDIQLAKVSNATIVAFEIKVQSKISNFAKQNKVEIKEYDIIYKAIEDMEKILKSMMAPKYEEKVIGHAEVRALFKISSVGTIAGCYVLDGKVARNSEVCVLRNGKVVYEGKVATLKREKDDAKEVAAGYECGIKVDGFNDVVEGDILECKIRQQINL